VNVAKVLCVGPIPNHPSGLLRFADETRSGLHNRRVGQDIRTHTRQTDFKRSAYRGSEKTGSALNISSL
jgi:hypothetical protein